MGVDFDIEKAGIVGQGRRSNVKVKSQKSCFDITVTLLRGEGQGQCQRSGSRSNFYFIAVDIRGAVLLSEAKSNKSQYQSKVSVCL